MPCQKVTVSGPEPTEEPTEEPTQEEQTQEEPTDVTGDVVFSQLGASGGVNEATVSYTLKNETGKDAVVDVALSVNGRQQNTFTHSIGAGERDSKSVKLSFNIPENRTKKKKICVDNGVTMPCKTVTVEGPTTGEEEADVDGDGLTRNQKLLIGGVAAAGIGAVVLSGRGNQ